MIDNKSFSDKDGGDKSKNEPKPPPSKRPKVPDPTPLENLTKSENPKKKSK